MSKLKTLASQTVVYGGSTILGRLLNFALFPVYTWLLPGTADTGMVSILYSYIAILNVLCTMGMETTYFYYSAKASEKNAFQQGLSIISMVALPITLFIMVFAGSIDAIHQTGNPNYYRLIALILLFDALAILPFAQLRNQNRAKRFALLKLAGIVVTVLLNLLFLYLCSALQHDLYWGEYFNPQRKVLYIFLANAISSFALFLVMLPKLRAYPPKWKLADAKRMMRYAWPLLVVGLAATLNETFDKPLLEYLLPMGTEAARGQVGIYGSVYRLGIAMAIAVQAFKFAAEPFFFSIQHEGDARQTYATVLKWFVIVECIIFLGVALNIDWIILIIEPDYREGKSVVGIILLAQMCLGVYYNLSVWYKLTEKTIYGMYMSLIGLAITLLMNFWLVPQEGIGYMGAAYATLSCYACMMFISFVWGKLHYPIPYAYGRMALYVACSVVFWLIFKGAGLQGYTQQIVVAGLLMALFLALVWHLEKPKNLILLRHKRG